MGWVRLSVDGSTDEFTFMQLDEKLTFRIIYDGSTYKMDFRDGEFKSIAIESSEENSTEWHHVAFVIGRDLNTVSTSRFAQFYFDGVRIPSEFNLAIGNYENYTGPIYIGADPANGTEAWNGWIDNVKVEEGVLWDHQVMTEYFSGAV